MDENKLLMNGVEVILKNPGTKGLKDFLIIQKSLSKMPKMDTKGKTKEQIKDELENSDVNFMDYFDDRAMDSLVNLIELSLNNTFKERTNEIDGWAMENNIVIIGIVIGMCSPKTTTDDEDRKEELKDKIKNAQSTTA